MVDEKLQADKLIILISFQYFFFKLLWIDKLALFTSSTAWERWFELVSCVLVYRPCIDVSGLNQLEFYLSKLNDNRSSCCCFSFILSVRASWVSLSPAPLLRQQTLHQNNRKPPLYCTHAQVSSCSRSLNWVEFCRISLHSFLRRMFIMFTLLQTVFKQFKAIVLCLSFSWERIEEEKRVAIGDVS